MLELLVGAALRSLFVAAAVGAALRLWRGRDPRMALTAWTLVLAASMALPLAMWLADVGLPDGAISVARLPPAPSLTFRIETSLAMPAGAGAPVSLAPVWSAVEFGWRELASLIWFAGLVTLLLRLLTGLAMSWRLARAATPVRDDWTGGLDVRASPRVGAPATFGSVILLPCDYAAWTPAKRLAVLAHEGAHVARRDFAIQLVAAINRAVFWFNPLSWWLRRHLADLAEAASDAAAVASLNNRFGYARILLEFASRAPGPPSAVAMARRGSVTRRIERILSGLPPPTAMSRSAGAILASGIVPLTIALSLVTVLPGPLLPETAPLEAAVDKIVAEPAATVDVAWDVATNEAVLAQSTVPPAAPAPSIEIATGAAEPQRPAPHLVAKVVLAEPMSRAKRRPVRADSTQAGAGGSIAASAAIPVSAPMRAANDAAGDDARSALFNKVDNETCVGTYAPAHPPARLVSRVYTYPVQAHFFRGPRDEARVRFGFGVEQPATLPVTVSGGEIKFTSASGTLYTLSPCGNLMLPARYHRLTGSAEQSSEGTIEVACGGTGAHL